MYIGDIPTPALILDKTAFEENLKAMEQLLKGSSLGLRPHYKSHKCAQIAKIQLAHGAVGMTCAKLSEAEDLADSGVENILIANQIVQPEKLLRLAILAGKCRLTVCVDHKANVDAVSAAAEAAGTTVHCLVEFEIGMERCGVTEKEQVLELAQYIMRKKNLSFEGIQAYAGHISHMESYEKRQELTTANSKKVAALVEYLKENGVPVNTVSGGSTGTAGIKAEQGLYTELQAGSYIFMDAAYEKLHTPFKNSLFLLTTVVSVKEGLAVVDSGVKTCGVDQGMPRFMEVEAKEVVASEEHFQLHKPSKKLKVGQLLRIVPAHCCSTVNLHDRIYLVEGDKVIDRLWITGRGFGK